MANRLRLPRLAFRPGRRRQARPMASPRSAGPPPGARAWLGWVAAAGGVVVVAFIAGRAGTEVGLPSATASPASSGPLAIIFGATLDPDSGEALNPTDTFRAGDPFAYSVRLPSAAAIDSMLLEVVRLEAAGEVTAQAPREVGIDATSQVISFSILVSDLLEAWGPGDYEMRMYLGSGTVPTAVGRFTLVEPADIP